MASFWSFTQDAESKTFLAVLTILPVVWWKRLTWESTTCYLALALTTYLTNRCLTPPKVLPVSPSPTTQDKSSEPGASRTQSTSHAEEKTTVPLTPGSSPKDAIKWVAKPSFRGSVKLLVAVLGLCHSSVALCLPSPPPLLCPHPEMLNINLFTWSPTTIFLTCLTSISVLFRLATYHQLGQNFTFDLASPTHLVTDGLYTYLRHPSYTFFIVAMTAYQFLVFRTDGAVACWDGGWWAGACILGQWCLFGFGITGLVRRIEAEEAMMRGAFGKEWDVWKAKTWRLVPWVW